MTDLANEEEEERSQEEAATPDMKCLHLRVCERETSFVEKGAGGIGRGAFGSCF